jgi:hypothetical protein
MNAFLTGSRVYGRPGPNSDIDLVVRVDPTTARHIRRLQGVAMSEPTPIRFGKLNLILCETDEQYEVWAKGTAEMIASKQTFDKVAAKAVFDKYREAVGLLDTYADGHPRTI